MKINIILILAVAAIILVSGCTSEEISLNVTCITPQMTTETLTPSLTESVSLTPEETESPANKTAWKADGIIEDGEYENEVTGFRDLFYIYWTSDKETLYMGIKGKTSGWILVGFNPIAEMKYADIITGGNKGTGGSLYIYDMYSLGTSGPKRSDTSLGGTFDLEEFAGTENSSFQTLEFSRKLDTGDKYDSVLVKGESAKVIWQLSNVDDIDTPLVKGEGKVEIII